MCMIVNDEKIQTKTDAISVNSTFHTSLSHDKIRLSCCIKFNEATLNDPRRETGFVTSASERSSTPAVSSLSVFRGF